MHSQSKYTLSFTTGAAFITESVSMAKLYSEDGNWPSVRSRVFEENTFQARTASTLKKLYGEISSRLKTLNNDEIKLLAIGTGREQRQLIWLAICQRHPLIRDFAVEVMSGLYDKAQFHLSRDDYNVFYNRLSEWNANLDQASPSTQSKARQVIFKMIRECGLISEESEIIPQSVDSELLNQLSLHDPSIIKIFPGLVI
jgi:hypothetical protein